MTRLHRVVLTGSESVGKTTLAGQLAAHYQTLMVPEFVRQFATQKGAPLEFSDHGPIARGQKALEDEYIARAQARGDELLVQDTDLVSTVVYHHHYYGQCPAFIEEMARERLAALYLLLEIDVPWVADGVRDRGDRRTEVQQLFVDTLTRLGAPVVLIAGDWASRMARAVDVIDQLRLSFHPIPSSVS